MKSILIIGMGTLGRHLARKMTEFGNEVLIMDTNEDIIQEMAQEFPNAIAGDCTSDGVLRSLGVSNFDFCFVTVGEDFYAALEITAILTSWFYSSTPQFPVPTLYRAPGTSRRGVQI